MLARLFVCLLVCWFACLLVCLLARLFDCLVACLLVCLFPCLLACSFACLLARLLACLLASVLACLLTYLLTYLLAPTSPRRIALPRAYLQQRKILKTTWSLVLRDPINGVSHLLSAHTLIRLARLWGPKIVRGLVTLLLLGAAALSTATDSRI